MATLRFRILGCGSSGGVPRLGNKWGACDPENPRNHRTRCSLLVSRQDGDGTTRALIDTSPDLRRQLLDADTGLLDGVVFTHAHADHVNGLDDLRMIFHNRGERLPVWADEATREELLARFGYAFIRPQGSPYPPILEMHPLEGPVAISGEGGQIRLDPFAVMHGAMQSKGFRIGPLAYLPDVSDMSEEAWKAVSGAECWIVDALRRDPHPTHAHLARTLEWIAQSEAKSAILTNMHIDLDYATLSAETPKHVQPAHDGLTLSYEI